MQIDTHIFLAQPGIFRQKMRIIANDFLSERAGLCLLRSDKGGCGIYTVPANAAFNNIFHNLFGAHSLILWDDIGKNRRQNLRVEKKAFG